MLKKNLHAVCFFLCTIILGTDLKGCKDCDLRANPTFQDAKFKDDSCNKLVELSLQNTDLRPSVSRVFKPSWYRMLGVFTFTKKEQRKRIIEDNLMMVTQYFDPNGEEKNYDIRAEKVFGKNYDYTNEDPRFLVGVEFWQRTRWAQESAQKAMINCLKNEFPKKD